MEGVEAAIRPLAAENDRLRREICALEEALRVALDDVEQLKALAYHDSLTGLPNRRSFTDRFRTMLSAGVKQEFAVLFVDIDDFKRINESLGHWGADELLRELAAALDGLIRTVDVLHPPVYVVGTPAPQSDCVLSRLGGDEFVILLPGVKDRATAGSIATRILQRLECPFQVGGRSMLVTASIGIALYPSDGHTADILVTNADAAMYAAKQHGKARYEHYHSPEGAEFDGGSTPILPVNFDAAVSHATAS
jgi:GGDEF domain-containing protein